MPIYKAKNENFFKKWSPEMAYVLGFFAADGTMFVNPRGSCYISFTSTDYELLKKIKNILGSEHKIGFKRIKSNWKQGYNLQIGSKETYQLFTGLGFTPRKSKTIKFPKIPKDYLRDFIRGYFDGDGCISSGLYKRKNRKSPSRILLTRFTCGSRDFLEELLKNLRCHANISGGSILKRKVGHCFDLYLSIRDSIKIFNFMYQDTKKSKFLERKYTAFKNALMYYAAVA